MNNFVSQPSLAFAYTQVGQENSFGWQAMKDGLRQQTELFAKLAQSGEIRIETLAQSGQWFRSHFSRTPSTSVTALEDWKQHDRKTIWYDSRFYRLNILWQDGTFFIRDLHCFDENFASPTHEKALHAKSLSYETLPIMDWAQWTEPASPGVGMWPVVLSSDGTDSPMIPESVPIIKSTDSKRLRIQQPLKGGGEFLVICAENKITFTAVDGGGKPLDWAWKLVGSAKQKAIVQSVTPRAVHYLYAGGTYQLRTQRDSGSCRRLNNGGIEITANKAGTIVLLLETRFAHL